MKKLLLSMFTALSFAGLNAQTQVLADTSLEVTGGGGTDWASTSTNFMTVLCDANCGNCGGPCAPATGSWYAWFGGAGTSETGTLTQSFNTSTAGAAVLRFQYFLAAASGTTSDSTTVSIDGNMLWNSTGVDSVQYGAGYSAVTLPITNLASGAHSIDFYGNETGSGTNTYNSLVDDITLWVGGAIGYTEYDLSEGVAITVNNPDHFVNIAFTLPTAMDMNISITDMSGRVVASQDMKQVTNNYVNFNTMNYAAGVYNIVISNGFTTNVHKLVIQ
jgi:hypothetical protein